MQCELWTYTTDGGMGVPGGRMGEYFLKKKRFHNGLRGYQQQQQNMQTVY